MMLSIGMSMPQTTNSWMSYPLYYSKGFYLGKQQWNQGMHFQCFLHSGFNVFFTVHCRYSRFGRSHDFRPPLPIIHSSSFYIIFYHIGFVNVSNVFLSKLIIKVLIIIVKMSEIWAFRLSLLLYFMYLALAL